MRDQPTAVKISVALVTRNRADSLERCLKSWRAQAVAPFEIIVSDDSDPEQAVLMQQLATRFSCVYTPGPRRGLYANRNHASLKCSGTHILSADDDHTHPIDYVKKVQEVVVQHPDRIWIFSERHPSNPNTPLVCPAELHRSGHGCAPKDPQDCAAIADGTSVYPREIFDRGLRYDEAYPFGSMWYLWGKVLVKHGWRISFSDATFVWHHSETSGRLGDKEFLKKQISCTQYVLFVDALYVTPSLARLCWAFLYLARRMAKADSMIAYLVKARLDFPEMRFLARKVFDARKRY